MVDGGREAANMLCRHVFAIPVAEILVEDREDLVVEDLEFADSVHHLLQLLKIKKREKKEPSVFFIYTFDDLSPFVPSISFNFPKNI